MMRKRSPTRKSLFPRPRVERLEDRTTPTGLGLQSGDLVAGVQATNAFGELVSQIDLVRNGTVTPISAPLVGFHPVEVKADSSGRVVFLGVDYNFNNWGLYRVDTLGAAPELLGAFPGNVGALPDPIPFPGEYFVGLSGLHLEGSTAITIAGAGSPQVATGEVYAFAARSWNPSTGQGTGLQTVRYHVDTGVWDLGGPQALGSTAPFTQMPDMASGNGYVYSVLDGTLRRSKLPLEVNASGSAGGSSFSAQLSLFGGYQQIQGITVNDTNFPGIPGCPNPPPPPPQVNPTLPGMGFGLLDPMSGFQNVVYDSYGGLGLTITSNYGPIAGASGPVMGNVSEQLLDKPDDLSQYFQDPYVGCAAVPELNFAGVIPGTNPATGFNNGIIENGAQLASSPQGVVGVAQGQLWLIAPGNGLQAITSNIGAISVAAYPPATASLSAASLAKSLLFAIDSPVNVLITDPQGRRLGVDPGSGQFVNDFGLDGFDSGPGEPRFYGIDHPVPGEYSVQAVGTGDGSFGFNVYSIDRTQPVGKHIEVTGSTSVGQSSNPNFTFAADGAIQFDNTTNATAPTLTVTDAGGIYNTQPFPAGATATGVDGAAVAGAFAFSYYSGSTASGTGSASAPINAGIYTVVASFTSSDSNYADTQSGPVTFTIGPASPLITVSDAGGLFNGQPFPASATAQKPTCGCPVSGAFTFTYTDGHGNTSATAPAVAGTYSVIASFTSADPNYDNAQSNPLVFTILAPASLSGVVFEDFNDDGRVDFGEAGIHGAAVALNGTNDLGNAVNLPQTTDADGAYLFLNLRPGNYKITETQPAGYLQGIDTVGTAAGSLSGNDQFSIPLGPGINGENYNFGEQPAAAGSVKKGQAAGIGFWNNKNGQALIKSFNGGVGTELADWLAATMPNTFGVTAGSGNLSHKSNAYVANLFQQDFVLKGVKLDAQVLATALNVYATNATLDATGVAAKYGFTVGGDGVGAAGVNVGSDGSAFGAANNTTMTVIDLLKATDLQSVNGVLFGGNTTKRNMANDLFSAINQAGGL